MTKLNLEKIKEIAEEKHFANHSPVGCGACYKRFIAKAVLDLVDIGKKRQMKTETEKEIIEVAKRVVKDTFPKKSDKENREKVISDIKNFFE